jgi:hypothetical protein
MAAAEMVRVFFMEIRVLKGISGAWRAHVVACSGYRAHERDGPKDAMLANR